MGVTEGTVTFTEAALENIQRLLRELDLDGWLLCDFRGSNGIATGMVALPPLTRRWFVYIPAQGRPTAITHKIEQQPWVTWIGKNTPYLSWQSLEDSLRHVLAGSRRIAVEFSPGNAVPYVDRLPGGMVELIRSTGTSIESSGDLVSAFYSRWDEGGLASHLRAGATLRETAFAAFSRIGEKLRSGEGTNEWEMRAWVRERLANSGLTVGVDAIVAVNANAANPHYAPGAAAHEALRAGDLVLLDLWGKENDDAVYADQTWMAYTGRQLPDRIGRGWRAVLEAREAAVELLQSRHASRRKVEGFEVDDAARSVITQQGYGEFFIHRTGHSIDRELHGSGPNIDNLETRDTRALIEGIGFSIEPGIYLQGDFGIRSEIDVFMSHAGPVVTTPDPQREIHMIEID